MTRKSDQTFSASSSTKTVLVGERTWIEIEPKDYAPIDYPVSKSLSGFASAFDRQENPSHPISTQIL